jgi:uncharacterized protein YjcR
VSRKQTPERSRKIADARQLVGASDSARVQFYSLQYTDQEMVPARNARNVVTLAEAMFVTIQRENILPSKITD